MQYNTFKKSGTPRPLSFLKRSNGDSGDSALPDNLGLRVLLQDDQDDGVPLHGDQGDGVDKEDQHDYLY